MRGKIIVIEGIDGSGKRTQAKALVKRLKALQIPAVFFSFPNYKSPTGKIIGGPYLGKPKIGSSWFKEGATAVNPKVCALYYAADRYYNLGLINSYLKKGTHVILDRYITSNMAHQGGKIKDKTARFQFYDWVFELEYNLLGLPTPELTIFLHLPYQYSLMLRKQRVETDAHEASKTHLVQAEKAYLELAEYYQYAFVDGVEAGKIKPIATLNDEIFNLIKPVL